MRLHARLALLMVLLVLLPGIPAAWMARELVTRSLDLGLSSEVDVALEAGVRHARESYLHDRSTLADSLTDWVGSFAGERADAQDVTEAARGSAGERLPAGWVTLRAPGGPVQSLRGAIEPAHDDSSGRDAPPSFLSATRTLADGSILSIRRRTDEAWRNDARALAAALQVVRGLQVERRQLEHGFWLPFLAIYAISLLAALAVAALLARGIVVPLQRLLEATRAIGAGRWDVRVPVKGRDELAHLSTNFNEMVSRLDAQSRRLVDLETMAGWREMARALAHEVKNPLTPIQLTVEEMRERYRGEDREYAALLDECTRIVVQEVESLRNVVGRFREFSRPVEPTFAAVNLNALVADVGALQRDVRVDLDLAPDSGEVRADDDRLRQVLMNLARNAQAATVGREEPRLRLATRPAGDRVILIVEDNGPGIPIVERERVFEPYRSGTKGGLGLGLALVKGIVLAHGGLIRAEEGQWGGARFHIELPRDPEASRE
jgi:nitrogen fixation/metabolism regulation signal transduction histidine kinase